MADYFALIIMFAIFIVFTLGLLGIAMLIFRKPRETFKSTAKELEKGLRNGSIKLKRKRN